MRATVVGIGRAGSGLRQQKYAITKPPQELIFSDVDKYRTMLW